MRAFALIILGLVILSSGCVSDQMTYRLPDPISTTNYISPSPLNKEIIPGESFELTLSITNGIDSEHNFITNIIPMGTTLKDCTTIHESCASPLENMNLFDFIDSWIVHNKTILTLKSKESDIVIYSFNIPENVQNASYFFYIYACYDKDGTIQECDSSSENWLASPKSFTIVVED